MKKEYKVSVSDDWVAPEETLLDSGSGYQDLEVPISDVIFRAGFFMAAVFCIVVIYFVFNLSILKHGYFVSLAFQNKTVNFSVPPPRGIIFDRLGMSLVSNEPVFDLLAISKEIDGNEKDITGIAGILGIDKDAFTINLKENTKINATFVVKSGLTKNEVLGLKLGDFKGFYVASNTRRKYADGSQFSSVLGYVGKVSKKDLEDVSGYYKPTDTIGRLGIEAQYEEKLRGEHGKIFFDYGNETDLDFSRSAEPSIGNSIVLNIDYSMQKQLFNELFGVLKDTKYSKAAALVQNPQTGAVLALESFPVYDNNIFVDGLSDGQLKSLFENKSRPLFNRVISGLYNPGSTIKPFMGLMALEEKIFKPSDTIKDCIGLTVVNPYNPDDSYTFKNWRLDYGQFNLKKAIANSCNVYFFIVGGGYGHIKGLGIEKIASYLKRSFADSLLGIDIPGEENGFVPTSDWKLSARGENWYQGDTYNVSIGQGDLLVTPLWLNTYISAIANGGTVYRPYIANEILDKNKNRVELFKSTVLGRLSFSDDVLKEIKNAMLETTISGTARLFGSLPVKSGAKTGTAEVIKGQTINSIMTAFAPFDNPEISITVLIEGSSTNEGLAVRTAYGFMKWYFEEYQKTH